ncbi:MAG TPA: hypothetical protein VF933_19440 [Streptosporangiaceae bacterium]
MRNTDISLLAAIPGQDTLAAYSSAVVDQALQSHVPLQHKEVGHP